MSDLPIGDVTTSAIYQAMQGLSDRQQAIAHNVANINTPGYKAQQVSFEQSLADAVGTGAPGAAQVTYQDSTAPAQQNGNNVNLATETVDGEKTNLAFQTMVQAMNAKFQLLSTAISGQANGS